MGYFFALVLVFLVPASFKGVVTCINKLLDRRKMFIFHYVEYSYDSKPYTTRENGALNDLAGVGLLKEIAQRGGAVQLHRTGSEEEIENYIDYRYNQLKEEGKL